LLNERGRGREGILTISMKKTSPFIPPARVQKTGVRSYKKKDGGGIEKSRENKGARLEEA